MLASDYPSDMDVECIPICDAINALFGLETYQSCCGHGERPFRIFFAVKHINDPVPLLYYIDRCHTRLEGKWQCVIYTDCGMAPTRYMLEGPVGDVAYRDSEEIAKNIMVWLAAGADGEKDSDGDVGNLDVYRKQGQKTPLAKRACPLWVGMNALPVQAPGFSPDAVHWKTLRLKKSFDEFPTSRTRM